MNRPVHFEIHAADPDRAAKFYAAVFGWEIKKWDNPAMEYWMIMTGKPDANEKWPGIDGGLLRRKEPGPVEGAAVNAYVCTMTVASIDESVAKIVQNGGTVTVPKAELAGMGWLAYAKDTEGNIFGMMQMAPQTTQ